MFDLLPAIEYSAKAVRSGFGAVGLLAHNLVRSGAVDRARLIASAAASATSCAESAPSAGVVIPPTSPPPAEGELSNSAGYLFAAEFYEQHKKSQK